MIHFNLEKPVQLNFAGEFSSPDRGWKHLTRVLTDYELMIVTEGELFIGSESENYTVQAGEYFIMSPTRYQHGTAECRCRFYWVHFSAPALPASLSLPPQGKLADVDKIAGMMKALFVADGENHGGLRAKYLATALLFEVAAQNSAVLSDGEMPDAAHALSERAKGLVAAKRFSVARVKEIADELGYHEKYLSAVFRKTEGITLKRYISLRRSEEAKRILLETESTVAEIAYLLSFDDPHNFSRFFKAEEGITPTEFRNRARRQ